LTLKIIEEEIKNAESFDPPLDVFYIATIFPIDATLQKQVRLISKKRRESGKFPVGIFFWNDIEQELVTNEKLFKKHFPQISLDSFQSKKPKLLFSLLELSFHGLNLKHYSDVLYGEFGFLAQEDPRKMEIICSIIESACIVTCSNEEQIKIKSKIDHFLNYLNGISFFNANTGWAAGNSGTILSTTDGGDTWTAQNSGVSSALNGIYFTNARIGWAVGVSSTILKTANSGITWSLETSCSNREQRIK
jgi:hypothetical protein